MKKYNVAPFVKWAGGKRWLVERRPDLFPSEDEGRYFEPFVGGGAVFFYCQPRKAVISDMNGELIGAYQAIKSDWEKVYSHLITHQRNHSSSYYYQIRGMKPRNEYTSAARFLYLNRTCWNGLYRVNLKGDFNVPIGTKSKVVMEEDDFEAVSRVLRKAMIISCDFQKTIDMAAFGDFIFCDPPYTVSHNENGFIKYNQKLFSWDDQLRLRDSLVMAKKRGAKIVATNANHKSIRDIYACDFNIEIVSRKSVISGALSGRGDYKELVIRG